MSKRQNMQGLSEEQIERIQKAATRHGLKVDQVVKATCVRHNPTWAWQLIDELMTFFESDRQGPISRRGLILHYAAKMQQPFTLAQLLMTLPTRDFSAEYAHWYSPVTVGTSLALGITEEIDWYQVTRHDVSRELYWIVIPRVAFQVPVLVDQYRQVFGIDSVLMEQAVAARHQCEVGYSLAHMFFDCLRADHTIDRDSLASIAAYAAYGYRSAEERNFARLIDITATLTREVGGDFMTSDTIARGLIDRFGSPYSRATPKVIAATLPKVYRSQIAHGGKLSANYILEGDKDGPRHIWRAI